MTSKKVFVNDNGKWEMTMSFDDENFIYKSLAEDMIFHYLIKTKSVKRVAHKLYGLNDWEITFYHSNSCKVVYRITR